MLTLAAWLHNIDPFAIQFPENPILPGIRWYGLAYLTAFAAGYFFARRIVKVGISTLRSAEVMDFVISVAISVVVGGRLGYVIFYKPALLTTFVPGFPYWGVLQLSQGGMASHGGMIGVGVVCWWYAWRSRRRVPVETDQEQVKHRVQVNGNLIDHTRCYKCNYDLFGVNITADCPECGAPVKRSFFAHPWLHLFDITTMAAAVGFLFGRIANFINAELIGRVCSPDLPWAVKFPQDLNETANLWIGKPGSAQEAAAQKLIDLTPAVLNVPPGKDGLALTAQQWHDAIANGDIDLVEKTIHRIIDTIQDGGSRGALVGEQVAPLLATHHPSQLYAAVTEGLIILIVLAWVWRKPRKPGVVAGLFGGLYGIMRIINEFFRTPDAHIANQEFAAIGLTRGQLLSVVLALFGFVTMWWCARRDRSPMGGWMKNARELAK
jgi:phosphatidylglycerol:prolipoprotein diacylglycerol transferase